MTFLSSRVLSFISLLAFASLMLNAPALDQKIAMAEEVEAPAEKGVVLVGELEITESYSGRAMIKATLKNEFENIVGGIRLDVILFHAERKRIADLAIPFEAGKVKPDHLAPGESGAIEFETEFMPEDISGFRYRVVWAYGNVVAAPKEGEEPEEGVTHIIRSKSTGEARKAD